MKYLVIPIFIFLASCGKMPTTEMNMSVKTTVSGFIDVSTMTENFRVGIPIGNTEKVYETQRLTLFPQFSGNDPFRITVTVGNDTLYHGAGTAIAVEH